MKKSVVSILVALWSLSASAQSLGVGSEFKTYSNRQVDLLLQTRYYNAQGNFKSSGNSYDSLPNEHSFQIFHFDLAARTQIFDKWAAFASGTVGYGESKNPTTRANSALSEATIGTDFQLSEGQIGLIPELSLTFPFTKNDYKSDTVGLSDGATAATARLIAQIRSNNFRFGAFAGYMYRTEDLSSLFLYGGLLELIFKGMDLGADIRGFTSVGYDKANDNDSVRNAYFCRANGCAKRYDAINPSLLESNLWARWKLSAALDLNLGAGFAITGQNTSTGYSANLGFLYRWGLGPTKASRPASPNQPRSKAPDFQEETNDGVDQTLFAPAVSPQQPVVAPPAPPPPPPPPPKRRVNPDAQRKEIHQKMQDDLNKTEMQIELKSSKKKKPPVEN